MNDQYDSQLGQPGMEAQGYVWEPYAYGGGQWVRPTTVALRDSDIERIADAVIRKMHTGQKMAAEALKDFQGR